MGQKVNPNGLRLGINQDWQAKWYSNKKDFANKKKQMYKNKEKLMTKPMTITEKIFASHAGKDYVAAGDLITAKVDITLANDITAPVSIKEFEKIGVETVFDNERVVFVPDHFVPNKDIKSAEQAKIVREFSKKHNIKNYFDNEFHY